MRLEAFFERWRDLAVFFVDDSSCVEFETRAENRSSLIRFLRGPRVEFSTFVVRLRSPKQSNVAASRPTEDSMTNELMRRKGNATTMMERVWSTQRSIRSLFEAVVAPQYRAAGML